MKYWIINMAIPFLLLLGGCGKEFLDVKQLKSLQVPNTIADFQAIVDYDFNFQGGYSAHTLGANGADEFIITEAMWNSLATGTSMYLRDIYTWAKDINMLQYESNTDWGRSYVLIFYANQALSGIASITPAASEQAAWNNVKGQALFMRALRYYHLAQQFAFPYSKSGDSPYGLPLRLEPDVTLSVKRSSVHATYDQILKDALASVELLPVENRKTNYIRPGRAAAYALIAKICLQMEDYEKAASYADKCLEIQGQLIDFNNLDAYNPAKTYDYMFAGDYGATNPEMIYYTTSDTRYGITLNSIFLNRAEFDPSLIALYEPGDIRSKAYFRPYVDFDNYRFPVFKGSYATYGYFSGLATDEIYLLRAECKARLNQMDEALEDLNLLRKNRFLPENYSPLTETDQAALLQIIFNERRRELVFRGVRWEDLRRMNKDPRLAQTLVREISGQRYELPPGDNRYTWPIPMSEIDAAGLTQNPR
ncbi:RagB/SusD family nutrient uptake outer membrane protein [Pseudobacter ginsenosidimutans]|jgi:hypothetical protein|uniref:SusD-like starch-binding protein associating with outer membrane n=1 Tax=Pseudobacter ginsenosidimutans TaxID=661488 RepID=A0A4Q7MNH0_9BACT|nr:RagB/SusD family nutrient uptake outer membrane protein [Pseudobacter ginsenosidimutans]QEC40270.1 RagB/SusD family nutrient uptake outer membrane protein [Pseudobacter ginsenosidimutans]RZS69128.1 SusD-like starch-binding protein associating with outer membrane [Pseudobacter ginsenosidimutans]